MTDWQFLKIQAAHYHKWHIIINCNMKIVNYLDVTLNLNTGSYRPYKKPNEEIIIYM